MAQIRKGSIEEVKAASDQRIQLVLLRKDFSKESFLRIVLNDATISKCVFNETKFFANEYTNCDFIACNFSKADFLNVKFKECHFLECNFNQSIMQEVNFQNCSLMTCTFENAQFNADVVGLDEKDLNVIHQEADVQTPDFTQFGFEKQSDEEFSISGVSNDTNVCLAIVLDPQMGKNIWRIMFMVNDDSYLSDTIQIDQTFNKDEAFIIIQSILINGKKKAIKEAQDSTIADDINNATDEIKSKLVLKNNIAKEE